MSASAISLRDTLSPCPSLLSTIGRCPSCGYDLRGASASQCSECGATLRLTIRVHRSHPSWSSMAWIVSSGLGIGVATFSLVSTLSMSLASGTKVPVELPLAFLVISACATISCFLALDWFERQGVLVRASLVMVFLVSVAFELSRTARFFNAHFMIVQT